MAPPPPPDETADCSPGRWEDSGQPCESTRAPDCNGEEADWVVVVEVVEMVWLRGDMWE